MALNSSPIPAGEEARRSELGQAGAETAALTSQATRPSRRRATAWSLFFSYGSVVLVIVRNLALVPLYLKYMTLEEYGAWLATGGVLGYLTMVDFGLMGLLTQQAAVAYGAGDREKLGRLIGAGLRIAVALSLLAGLLAVPIAPFLPRVLSINGGFATRLSLCFLIVAGANSMNLVSYAAGGVLKSFQRTFLPGILNVVSDAISIGATVVLLVWGWGLYAIAFGLGIRSLVAMVGNLAGCLRACRAEMGLQLACKWADTAELWRLSLYQFCMRVGVALLANSDAFLVGVILGTKEAGIYVLTLRAHEMIRTLAGRFGDAIMPSLAHLHGEGHLDRFRSIVVMAVRIQAMVALIGIVGVLMFNEAFMSLWVGRGVFAGNAINILVGVYGASGVISGVMWHSLYAMGELANLTKLVWLEGLVKAPLTIGLLLTVGIVGAPVGTLCGNGTATAFLVVLAIRRMGFGSGDLWGLVRDLAKLMGPVLLACSAVAGVFASPVTWRGFGTQVILYMLLGLILTVVLNRDLVRFVLRGGRGLAA